MSQYTSTNMALLSISESFTCPVDYFKCENAFCLANWFICDGIKHCKNGEDEYNCGNPPFYQMGLIARKSVFRVSDKATFKPVSSATGISQKIEISPVASLHMILSTKRITKALIRLRGCSGWSAPFVFHKLPKTGFLATRPKLSLHSIY